MAFFVRSLEYRMKYEKELELAIQAVRNGFSLASAAQNGLTKSDTAVKGDASPVTVADFAVQAVVNRTLTDGFDYPIMAEESADRGIHPSWRECESWHSPTGASSLTTAR